MSDNAEKGLADFLSRVVPWPQPGKSGFINVLTFPSHDGMGGKPFTELSDALSFIEWAKSHPEAVKDLYYCLSLQAKTGPERNGKPTALRKRENAVALKAVWLDIDCNKEPPKGYRCKYDGLRALKEFCEATKTPYPTAIIDSGNGLHVYWISDKPLSAAEWLPYAEGLDAVATQHELFHDFITTDAARVLRVPGSSNNKQVPPKPVKILLLAPDLSFASELSHLLKPGAEQKPADAGAKADLYVSPEVAYQGPAASAQGKGAEAIGQGVKDDWWNRLTPAQRDVVVHYILSVIAETTKWLKLSEDGGDNKIWLRLIIALAVSGAPHAKEYFVEFASKVEGADSKDALREKFEYHAKTANANKAQAEGLKTINVGTLLHYAYEAGADLSPWKNQAEAKPAVPEDPFFVDPYADFAGPAFPVDVLPPTLGKFVDAEQRCMGADPSAIAIAALTAVAGAMHADTLIKAAEGWWERPILWTALVGLPSTMKSPTINKVMRPLSKIDQERDGLWRQSYAKWQRDKDEHKDAQVPQPAPPPKPARCVINDATPEKVAEILSRDPSGVLMHQDELAGWLGSFERYNAGQSSRAFYLSSWNGGPFLKDRVGKGKNDPDAEIRVDNLAVGILGGIQPDKLKFRELTSDGLLQRLLIVLVAPAERGDQYYPVEGVEDDYEKLIRSISEGSPKYYQFSKEALEVRDRVMDHLHKLENCDGFSAPLIGAIGKLKGYFARICLVLHVASLHDPIVANEICPIPLPPEQGGHIRELPGADLNDWAEDIVKSGPPISRQTAEAVERLLREFLLPHIFGLYDVVVNGGQDRDLIRSIGDFILASPKDRLRPSDMTSGVRALRGEPEQKIREWVGRFCAMGWLEPEEDQRRPGLPPKAWRVVPGLREHFAERRKRAAAARAEAHAILKAGGSRKAA